MQKSDFILIKRYARAFLSGDVSKDEKRLGELTIFAKKLSSLDKYLLNPCISVTIKKGLFARAFTKYKGSYVFKFIELLVSNRRFSLLGQITTDIAKFLKERKGIKTAHLTTAGDLDDYQSEKFEHLVKKLTGKTPEISHLKNPALIGGFQMKIDDDFIDASISGRLNKLKEVLHK